LAKKKKCPASLLFGRNPDEKHKFNFFTWPKWLDENLSKWPAGRTLLQRSPLQLLTVLGVREIGRRSLLTSLTGFFFGTGTMPALFHDGGRQPSWKEQL
jgi:hypothetical protein